MFALCFDHLETCFQPTEDSPMQPFLSKSSGQDLEAWKAPGAQDFLPAVLLVSLIQLSYLDNRQTSCAL